MLVILQYVTKLSPSLAPRHICSQVGQLFAYFFTSKKSVCVVTGKRHVSLDKEVTCDILKKCVRRNTFV